MKITGKEQPAEKLQQGSSELNTAHQKEQTKNKISAQNNNPAYEDAYIMGGLYGDGIIALKGAFSREWVKALDEDLTFLYEEALKRPGGGCWPGSKAALCRDSPGRYKRIW
jgi:predicted transcriptional regulator YheO